MRGIGDDDLDRALQVAGELIAPRTPELEWELARLSVATRTRGRRTRSHRVGAIAAAGGVALLLAGGAAAAATGLWRPWAETPDGTFTYVLPSGIECEERVGEITAENPEVRAAIQSIFRDTDVVAAADPAQWERRLEAQPDVTETARSWIESGRTTLPTVDDVIAQMAMSRAVNDVVITELEERGFDPERPDNMIASSGQAICTEEGR